MVWMQTDSNGMLQSREQPHKTSVSFEAVLRVFDDVLAYELFDFDSARGEVRCVIVS